MSFGQPENKSSWRIGLLSSVLCITTVAFANSNGDNDLADNIWKMISLSLAEHWLRFCQMMSFLGHVWWLVLIVVALIVYIVLRVRKNRVPDIEKMRKNNDIEGLIAALAYGRDNLRYANRPQHEQYENNIAAKIRANAAFALGVFRDERAVEPLIESLKDKNRDVRIYAVRALIGIGDIRAVEPLRDVAENDPDEYARTSVKECLRARGY